jgi:hypothetical protein
MPTQIDSAGITFNDTTSLTSANIGTAQLVNGSVIASKLGTNEQKQICKAWVNFDGTTIGTSTANTSQSVSVTAGSDIGTFNNSGTWTSNFIGQIYYINSIAGVSGATLGGVDVAISGIKIISASGTSATVKLLGGVATSSQTITGTGSPSTGFVFSTSGIRSSYNVSSVTKNGTGDYTVNFSTAMTDANYSFLAASGASAASCIVALQTTSTTNCRFYTTQISATLFDNILNCVSIFGN